MPEDSQPAAGDADDVCEFLAIAGIGLGYGPGIITASAWCKAHQKRHWRISLVHCHELRRRQG